MYSAIVSKRRRQECSRYLSFRMLARRLTCDLVLVVLGQCGVRAIFLKRSQAPDSCTL